MDNTSKLICDNPNHDKNLCKPNVKINPIYKDGLGCTLLAGMRANGDKVAQIDSATGSRERYDQLLSRCIRIAQNLRKRGITPDDTVSFCTMNNMDCFAAAISVLLIGAKIASLDPILTLKETSHLLKMIEPKLIFCDEEGIKVIEKSFKDTGMSVDIVLFGETKEYIPFSNLLVKHSDEASFQATKVKDIQDTAFVFFTSGTTGLPKGITISHFSMIYQCTLVDYAFVTYAITRLYWISSSIVYCSTIIQGGSWIVDVDFDMTKLFKNIQDYEISLIVAPPLYSYKITQNANHCIYDTSSLLVIALIGGITAEEQKLQLKKLFPKTVLLCPYGLSETCGSVCNLDFDEIHLTDEKPKSSGKVVNGNCIKVVDVETDEVVGVNTPGELRVKCGFFMNGYFKNPTATADSFDSEGYFCTGDIVYYDEDYCFYVVDRIKDMMKFRAFQIAPAELEGILLSHPDIHEAIVTSIPHPEDGDLPTGVVVLRDGAQVTEEEIYDFVSERVVDYKNLRGGVKIVKDIPKTPTFKLRRRDLRNMILNKEI